MEIMESNLSTREIEGVEKIRQILYGKIYRKIKKYNININLPKEDIEDIVSEILTWALEKVSKNTKSTKSNYVSIRIPFISDKLITMFVFSYIKYKYYEIPLISFDDDMIEYLDFVYYYTNNNSDNEDDEETGPSRNHEELDDFQILKIVDILMTRLEEYKKKTNNYEDSKLIVNKKIIKEYLYILLKYGLNNIHTIEYKNMLSASKKYRLEKNLQLLSTLI